MVRAVAGTLAPRVSAGTVKTRDAGVGVTTTPSAATAHVVARVVVTRARTAHDVALGAVVDDRTAQAVARLVVVFYSFALSRAREVGAYE